MFTDKARIFIKAGDGGSGCVSFRREKYIPAGGPDGGDGGCGGDVYFLADPGIRTLSEFSYKRIFKAEAGEGGKGNNMTGRSGKTLIIKVPVGTVVYDEETGRIMANLTEPNAQVKVLSGGRGGRGNARFATPTRKAPAFAQPGEKREGRWVKLELKTLADIGLVGFPNVGKSTILSMITNATPKIADYPFTTLSPNIGIATIDQQSYVIADIPGLIEGASKGQGLGHDFLRHIERTRMLIHVLDASGYEGRDPVEDFETIMKELRLYSESLAQRPMIIAANKTDVTTQHIPRIRQELKDYEVFEISAATNMGLTELFRRAAEIVNSLPRATFEPVEFNEADLEVQKTFEIKKLSEGVYQAEGTLIEDILSRVYKDDKDSMKYFSDLLIKHGIIDALRNAGAKHGDTVLLEDIEFDFVD